MFDRGSFDKLLFDRGSFKKTSTDTLLVTVTDALIGRSFVTPDTLLVKVTDTLIGRSFITPDTLLVKVTDSLTGRSFVTPDSLLVTITDELKAKTFTSQDDLKISFNAIEILNLSGQDSILFYIYGDVNILGEPYQAYDVLLLAGGGDEKVEIIEQDFLDTVTDDLLLKIDPEVVQGIYSFLLSSDTLLGTIVEESSIVSPVSAEDTYPITVEDTVLSLDKWTWGVDIFLKTGEDTLYLDPTPEDHSKLWTLIETITAPPGTGAVSSIPEEVTEIIVMVVGGGGGGGGGGNGDGFFRKGEGGLGGSAGEVVFAEMTVTPGDVISLLAGASKGLGGASGHPGSDRGKQGQTGGTATFNHPSYDPVIAQGGGGGLGGLGVLYLLEATDGGQGEEVPKSSDLGEDFRAQPGHDGSAHPDSGGLPGGLGAGCGGGGGGGSNDGGGGSDDLAVPIYGVIDPGIGGGGRGGYPAVFIFAPVLKKSSIDPLPITISESNLIDGNTRLGRSDDLIITTPEASMRWIYTTDDLVLGTIEQGSVALYAQDSLALTIRDCKDFISKRGIAVNENYFVSTNLVIPLGCTSLTCYVLGGGGGGGQGGDSDTWRGGGGAQGGKAATVNLTSFGVTPGQLVPIVVGPGGISRTPGGLSSCGAITSPGGAAGADGEDLKGSPATSGEAGENAPGSTGGLGGSAGADQTTGWPGSPGGNADGWGAGGGGGGGNGANNKSELVNPGPSGGNGSGGFVGLAYVKTDIKINSCDRLLITDSELGLRVIYGTDTLLLGSTEFTVRSFTQGDTVKVKVSEITGREFTSIDSLLLNSSELIKRWYYSQDDLLLTLGSENIKRTFISQDSLKIVISEPLTTRAFMRPDTLKIKLVEFTFRAFINLDGILLMKITEGSYATKHFPAVLDDLLVSLEDTLKARKTGSTDRLEVSLSEGPIGMTYLSMDQLKVKITNSCNRKITVTDGLLITVEGITRTIIPAQDDLLLTLTESVKFILTSQDGLKLKFIEGVLDRSLGSIDPLLMKLIDRPGDRSLSAKDSFILTVEGIANPPNTRDTNNFDDLLLVITEISKRTFVDTDNLPIKITDQGTPPGRDALLLTITEESKRLILSTDQLKIKIEEAVVFYLFGQDGLFIMLTEAGTDEIKNRTLRFISSGGTRIQNDGTYRSPIFYLLPED